MFTTNSDTLFTSNNNIEQYSYLNDYNLTKVTDVYQRLRENPSQEYYFLSEDKKPIKVTDIEKTRYAGKIYDVDVPNDVILVRRGGSTAVWSGNSNTKAADSSKYGNNGTVYGGAVWNSSGRFGGAYSFDGVDDYVGVPDSGSLNFNDKITLAAWANLQPAGVLNISTGYYHSCALLSGGSVICWGRNYYGQLGDGTNTVDSKMPVPVSGGNVFSQISLGGSHSCGRLFNGSVLCWGSNYYRQLGNGNTSTNMSYPVALFGVYNFSSVGLGLYHSCGVLFNGSVLCWGLNNYGELGNGNTSSMYYPVALSGVYNFSSVSAGDYHSCGVLLNGFVLCWGRNDYGELGLEPNLYSPAEALAGMVLGRSSDTWGLASTFGRGVVAFMGSLDHNTVRYDASGGWRHLVLTYDQGSSLWLYVDGLEVGSSVPRLSVYNQQTDVLVGRCTGSSVDEVRVWNRALSAQEVWLHYQSEFVKYNSTEYRFYSNLTNLTSGMYTYYGWANDSVGTPPIRIHILRLVRVI